MILTDQLGLLSVNSIYVRRALVHEAADGRVPLRQMEHLTCGLHVKGMGAYEDGVETPRANVVLATRIPEERCRKVNLGYRDPDSIDIAAFGGREDEGILCVPKAGEMLYHKR